MVYLISMMKVLFATTNPHKRERFQSYFKSLGIKVLSLSDAGVKKEVKEDGKTPEENAIKKAKAYFTITKMPTFAVDYSLYIKKFPKHKQPGLNVRRIGENKEAVTDEEMLNYYMAELDKVGGKSQGTWISAIALVVGKNRIFAESFSGDSLFTSKRSPKLTPGEPLNSIQIDPKTNKYFTDLTKKEWLKLQSRREKGYIDFMREHINYL